MDELVAIRAWVEGSLDFPDEEVPDLPADLLTDRLGRVRGAAVADARAAAARGKSAPRGVRGGDRRPAQRRQVEPAQPSGGPGARDRDRGAGHDPRHLARAGAGGRTAASGSSIRRAFTRPTIPSSASASSGPGRAVEPRRTRCSRWWTTAAASRIADRAILGRIPERLAPGRRPQQDRPDGRCGGGGRRSAQGPAPSGRPRRRAWQRAEQRAGRDIRIRLSAKDRGRRRPCSANGSSRSRATSRAPRGSSWRGGAISPPSTPPSRRSMRHGAGTPTARAASSWPRSFGSRSGRSGRSPGNSPTDDLLGRIFATFCIGK